MTSGGRVHILRAIESIDFESRLTLSGPVLLAITAEE